MGGGPTASLVPMLATALEELQDFYGTDSKVVLGFIRNDSRVFRVYVANRVQFTHNDTSPAQWRNVESRFNPADEGSRGLNAKVFDSG